jgi:hypothetical protein
MLLATPLSIGQITRAKLFASLSVFCILILVSLPMLSVCFILGGVSPAEIAWGYFLTVEGVFLGGVIGLCYSAYFKRTLAAVPISSLTMVIFLLVTLFIGRFLSSAIGLLNPLYAFWMMTSRWTTKFFVLQAPFWIPSLIMTLLLFLSVFAYASEILKEEKRRKSVWTRIFLLLFYSSLLVFLLGSTIEAGPDIASVIAGLTKYIYPSFVFCIVQAIIVSGGSLSAIERKKLWHSWKERDLRLGGWFGLGVLGGPRFSLLVAFVSATVFAVGVFHVKMLQRRLSLILMVGALLILSTLVYALLARLFSLLRRTQGKSLPCILASLCFLAAIVLPHLASYIQRRGVTEIPVTGWDIFILASPFVALASVLDPAGALESYPYCRTLLEGVPFSLITSLFYSSLLAVVLILNLLCERRIRLSESSN